MKKKTFEIDYWKANYSEPQTMDCIGNAKQHVLYLKYLFELEFIDISSVVDLGFGYGYLFQKMLKAFIPYRASGIEPSKFAYDKATARKLCPVPSTKLTLYNESIEEWCRREETKHNRFDLGICTSVFQYLSDEEIDYIIPILSMRLKYLYLTVPTDVELDKQISDLEFDDKYAIRRSRQFYQEKLGTHFTLVSNKVWESKHYFDETTTLFSDLLYRN